MLAQARRLLRDADLIHAHMFTSAMWGATLSRWTKVPLVVRDPTWSGERTFARTHGYRRLIGPTARVIVCPSRLVARSIAEEGVPAEKLEVITNGVRLEAALPRERARMELGLAADAWVIGIIAMLREEKAHEVLLRAVSTMVVNGRRPTLCIVGDGPRRGELEQLAGSLGLGDAVVWAGNRPDAGRLASAFDTAVICSNWEGLPLAALEALAAGTPLVATRVGAIPEVMAGGAGVLVDVADDAGLARELTALMDQPRRVEGLRARGLQRIEDEYRFETMVARFTGLDDSVLVRPTSP
jgi:glycosyltransferase involved in cell wall biosynthesis